MHRALADAHDAAVAAALERLLVQHLSLQAGCGGHPGCLVRQRLGVQVRGSGVDEIAGERHRIGEDLGAAADAVRIAAGVSTVIAAGRRVLSVPGECVAAQQRADGDCLGLRRRPGRASAIRGPPRRRWP